MNADKQGERRSWNGVCPVCLFLLVCDCPLTRLLSTALFAPFTRFWADPLGAEESQTCLIRHRRRRSLSAFIRVHPRLFCLFPAFHPLPPPISRSFTLILKDLPPRNLPARATIVSGGTFDRPTARSSPRTAN